MKAVLKMFLLITQLIAFGVLATKQDQIVSRRRKKKLANYSFVANGYCTASDIKKNTKATVQNCDCCKYGEGGNKTTCNYGTCSFNRDLNCNAKANFPCNECSLFYSTLCESIQKQNIRNAYANTNKCLTISSGAHRGIEDTTLVKFSKDYWAIAQSNTLVTENDRSFAMNSKNSRTQNQAHIHTGKVNGNTLKHLSNVKKSNAYVLVPGLARNKDIDPNVTKVHCKASIVDPIKEAQDYISKHKNDAPYIGVFTVEKKISSTKKKWTCVTQSGTAELFIDEHGVGCKP